MPENDDAARKLKARTKDKAPKKAKRASKRAKSKPAGSESASFESPFTRADMEDIQSIDLCSSIGLGTEVFF
jgi:hypothetical protein